MYHTCLYCRTSLGANEHIEHFPVGRRLAFDPAKGRLWVVCSSCARWNLTPLEARWEAIEECERLFRMTPVRLATDRIGLAVVGPFSLVRVGTPPRRELAWWRYGQRLRRRFQGAWAHDVAVLGTSIVALPTGLAALGLGSLGGVAAVSALAIYGSRRENRVLATLSNDGADAARSIVRRRHMRASILAPDANAPNGWTLQVGHDGGMLTLAGDRAIDVAALALATLPPGNPDEVVDDALVQLGRLKEPHDYFRVALERGQVRNPARRPGMATGAFSATLAALTPVERVALEMAATEERERRAAEGELADLEAAWRDAEEIAAISDNLLLPDAVTAWLGRHRREYGR